MNGGRIVSTDLYWINAHTNPPALGAKVQVLNRDGVQAGATVWAAGSIEQFDAWLPYARVPADVKALQAGRYKTT